MKPGDLIEFVHYKYFTPVGRKEQMWSSLMNMWIPLYGNFLLISNDKEISFLKSGILYSINHYDTHLFAKGKARLRVEIKKIDKLRRK
jgi:hypothetical protein